MKTEWDYSSLAKAYLKRPDYSGVAIDEMLKIANVQSGSRVCDVGAGVAHLTLHLVRRLFLVDAVEPNDEMRKYGVQRTRDYGNVRWFEGTGENTGLDASSYSLVTFGSSFNVTNRELALKESARILLPCGWLGMMWNHRKLDDPIQERIEHIIKNHIPSYDYGARREDQSDIILRSGFFEDVKTVQGVIMHEQKVDDVIEAWYSHATLERQAGASFNKIVQDIETYLRGLAVEAISVPYVTNIWLARKKS